jgi:cyclopropane fatty-acyl-phospholipid synthase-like methyltransferase
MLKYQVLGWVFLTENLLYLLTKKNHSKYLTIVKDMDIQSDNRLLEIGYGPGVGIHMIAQSCESCIVHGVDFSTLMYKKASKYNKAFIDDGKVKLQYGDFLDIPIAQYQYDKIFCLNVIYFWDELDKPFKKTCSLLNANGVFYIYMMKADSLIKKKAPDSVFNKYTIEQVVDALRLAGFSKIDNYYDKGFYIKAQK